ncbi:MAG: formate dehydrogenase subunit delta [Gammaproteobacteria bacterium]|nr:formate dehydrogenase subunit delta [Gammaproteobacteria bacterium]
MNVDHLVTMANEIAAFFDAEADKQKAAEQVANHLNRFWEPRMRAAIKAHVAAGGAGLAPLARRAVELARS